MIFSQCIRTAKERENHPNALRVMEEEPEYMEISDHYLEKCTILFTLAQNHLQMAAMAPHLVLFPLFMAPESNGKYLTNTTGVFSSTQEMFRTIANFYSHFEVPVVKESLGVLVSQILRSGCKAAEGVFDSAAIKKTDYVGAPTLEQFKTFITKEHRRDFETILDWDGVSSVSYENGKLSGKWVRFLLLDTKTNQMKIFEIEFGITRVKFLAEQFEMIFVFTKEETAVPKEEFMFVSTLNDDICRDLDISDAAPFPIIKSIKTGDQISDETTFKTLLNSDFFLGASKNMTFLKQNTLLDKLLLYHCELMAHIKRETRVLRIVNIKLDGFAKLQAKLEKEHPAYFEEQKKLLAAGEKKEEPSKTDIKDEINAAQLELLVSQSSPLSRKPSIRAPDKKSRVLQGKVEKPEGINQEDVIELIQKRKSYERERIRAQNEIEQDNKSILLLLPEIEKILLLRKSIEMINVAIPKKTPVGAEKKRPEKDEQSKDVVEEESEESGDVTDEEMIDYLSKGATAETEELKRPSTLFTSFDQYETLISSKSPHAPSSVTSRPGTPETEEPSGAFDDHSMRQSIRRRHRSPSTLSEEAIEAPLSPESESDGESRKIPDKESEPRKTPDTESIAGTEISSTPDKLPGEPEKPLSRKERRQRRYQRSLVETEYYSDESSYTVDHEGSHREIGSRPVEGRKVRKPVVAGDRVKVEMIVGIGVGLALVIGVIIFSKYRKYKNRKLLKR